MKCFQSSLLIAATLLGCAPSQAWASRPASKEELNRIINQSANFLKNREPEMTGAEYALYEKVVSMLSVQPDFAMQLLESMMSGKERPSPAFEFVLGNAYYNSNRLDLAEQHYRRALDQMPEYQRAWSNLGILYYNGGRYQEAASALGKAVELGDATSETLGLLGFAMQRCGNTVAAEMAYLRALGAAPENVDWIEGLFNIYAEGHQYGRAESLARQLIRLQPREAKHWLHYANLLVAQDRRQDAIVALETARGMQFGDDAVLLLLGDLYAQEHFVPEAMAVYREVQQRTPDIGTSRALAYAQMLVAERKPKAALELLAGIEAKLNAPMRGTFLETRAEAYAAMENWTAARQDLEAVLAIQPLNGAAMLRLGQVLKSADQPLVAQQILEAAVARTDVAYQAHLELADLALRLRHFRECADQLAQALTLQKTPAIQEYLEKIKTIADQEDEKKSNPSEK